MFSFLRRKSELASVRRGPAGCRAYAIGDVHGCLDKLRTLLAAIEADDGDRPFARTFIVLLGDLVDRGPDSCGVIDLLSHYKPSFGKAVFLMGNHEEFLLRVIDGDLELVPKWLTYGGRELAISYGVTEDWMLASTPQGIARELSRHIPAEHVAFLRAFGDSFRFGDYLMAHAGIRPGVALEDQSPHDLRWIREGFVDDRSDHGFTVVHGHTMVEAVEEHSNRIAIDTGAYEGGPLTAIGLEGENRWYLSA